MKKICLLILFLLLPCLAFGETAFPACQGTVTDLAAVMEENAVKDIEILSDRYEQAAGGRLYVITRHFLGGKEAANYTRTLFENWNLKENDILLMMVIGEENYALALGKEAQKALPDELAVTLFSTHFSSDFMNRQYNTAAGEILCQVSSAICKAQGKSFSTDGLFGRLETEPYQPSFTEELGSFFSAWLEENEPEASDHPIVKEAEDKGFSLWKTVLIIWLVYMIFFRKARKKRKMARRTRYNFGHGPRGN